MDSENAKPEGYLNEAGWIADSDGETSINIVHNESSWCHFPQLLIDLLGVWRMLVGSWVPGPNQPGSKFAWVQNRPRSKYQFLNSMSSSKPNICTFFEHVRTWRQIVPTPSRSVLHPPRASQMPYDATNQNVANLRAFRPWPQFQEAQKGPSKWM